MKFNQFWCLTAAKSTEPKNRDFSSSSSSSSSPLFLSLWTFGACEVLQKVKVAWEENVGGKEKKRWKGKIGEEESPANFQRVIHSVHVPESILIYDERKKGRDRE